jgi:hypothetical protein
MGIKEKYAQKKLHKLAGRDQRIPVVPNLESAKRIGVIWHPTQNKAFKYLKNYFKKEQVIFKGFCVFEDEINPPPDKNSLAVNDLNWLGFPKPEKINDFTSVNFDVLFNITPNQNLILDYITLVSKAKFKVGCSTSDSNYFDLNINIDKKDDTMYLVEQQIFYLAQLNKTTSK